ncbi:MAG: hypothetical protein JXR96_13035 [Deltaproteobacteria bacterium]|nr:hypothetical protein [Deltaproteobacteria bacterium]
MSEKNWTWSWLLLLACLAWACSGSNGAADAGGTDAADAGVDGTTDGSDSSPDGEDGVSDGSDSSPDGGDGVSDGSDSSPDGGDGAADSGDTGPGERVLEAITLLGEGGFFGISGRLVGPVHAGQASIAIGAHYADVSGGAGDPVRAGRLYLFAADAFPGALTDARLVLEPPDGAAEGDFAFAFGDSCDLNADGHPDLPVGNHLYGPSAALAACGRVVVFWGDAAGLDPGRATLHGLDAGLRAKSDCMGQTVLCADVDGDGIGDLVAGGQNAGADDTGLVAVWHGSEQGLAEHPDLLLTPPLLENRQYFGAETLWADLDGDGAEDLAIGGWGLVKGQSAGGPHTGGVLVYTGGSDWSAGPGHALFPDADEEASMGGCAALAETPAGRFLLVGASKADEEAGAIFAYALGEGFGAAPVQRLDPPAGFFGVGFGNSIAYAPDYFGRDRGALLAGMYYADASPEQTGTGAVAVFAFRDDEPPFAPPGLLIAPAPAGMDDFGRHIAPLGDVDSDGLQDFFVGIDSHIEGDPYAGGAQTGGVIFYH